MGSYTGTVPTFLAGELPDADKLTEVSNFMTAATTGWTTYTHANLWSGLGTAPAIVNGTLAALYRRLGKTVDYRFTLTAGSSTTFGNNIFIFRLPFIATAANIVGSAQFFDSSASTRKSGTCITYSGDLNYVFCVGEAGNVSSTVPWSWASSDQLMLSITYETT